MDHNVPADLKDYVDDKLRSGEYADLDALFVRALRVMRRVEEACPGAQDDLRREIDLGLRDLEEGRVSDWDVEEMKDEIRQLGRRAL